MRLRNIPRAKEEIAQSPYVIHDPQNLRGNWSLLLKDCPNAPVYLEAGMGKGQFIMEQAKLHPDILYIGIEMYDSVLLRAIEKRAKDEEAGVVLKNLYFLCTDARLLPEIFAPGEISKIYLNFSDPWPKERHAKRRLTSKEFLARYESILTKDAIVEFKTDNLDLFNFSLEEIKLADWNLLEFTYDLHHNEEMSKGNIMTEYEEKFSSMGNPICKLVMSPKKTLDR